MINGVQTLCVRASLACAAFLLLFASASAAWAGTVLIIGADDTTPDASGNTPFVRTATANLRAVLVGARHTVDLSPQVPEDLSTYDQVWDLRIDIGGEFASGVPSRYLGYLQNENGKKLILIGENASAFFMPRNTAIVALIAAAGGGSMKYASPTSAVETVQPPFNAPNPITTIQIGQGGVDSPGTGQFITVAPDNRGAGVAFGPGQLTNARAGTLIAFFDINFITNPPSDPKQQLLLRNIVSFLSPAAPPPPQTIGNVIPNAGRPYGVAIHPTDGFAYIADPESHTVWKFELSNPTNKMAVAGIGWNPEVDPLERAGYNGDGIDALHAQLSNPSGVAIDSVGNLYIADRGNHAVRRITAGSSIITTVAGIPTTYAVGENTDPSCESGTGDLSQCVPAINVRLFGPRALAVDQDDNVYIVDEMNYQVKKLYTSGILTGHIFVVAGVAGQPGSNDGPANGPVICLPNQECRAGARLNAPAGVAVSGSTVYIADSGNNKIRTVNSDGEVQTFEIGPLSRPTGVATGGNGIVYIADYGNHRIVRARNCGGEGCDVVTILGTTGTFGSEGGVGTPGTSVLLNSPIAVTLHGVLLYIADMLNRRVLSGDFTPPPPPVIN